MMSKHLDFFQTLAKKQGTCLKQDPWTAAQLNPSKVKLLNRKKLVENLLERILPLFEVSEELSKFAGLQPLYEGINLLDPHYCRRDEALLPCREKTASRRSSGRWCGLQRKSPVRA